MLDDGVGPRAVVGEDGLVRVRVMVRVRVRVMVRVRVRVRLAKMAGSRARSSNRLASQLPSTPRRVPGTWSKGLVRVRVRARATVTVRARARAHLEHVLALEHM